jgi:hypothetical protein
MRVRFVNRPPTDKEAREKGLFRISPKLRERKFKPHALVLGQVVLAWSELHEALGRLFWATLGGPDPGPALAVWHANRNDRSQRFMLRGAAEAALSGGVLKALKKKRTADDVRAYKDIIWLLDQVETASSSRDMQYMPHSFFKFPLICVWSRT